MASQRCPKCGYERSPFETACPRCARSGAPDGPTGSDAPPGPTRSGVAPDEPMAPAPGQEHATGSIGHLVGIAKADPLFAILLLLLAVGVALNLFPFNCIGVVISVAVFWGVFSQQTWGWWLAVIGSGLGGAVYGTAFFVVLVAGAVGARGVSAPLAVVGIVLGVYLFCFVVLLTRRRYFF